MNEHDSFPRGGPQRQTRPQARSLASNHSVNARSVTEEPQNTVNYGDFVTLSTPARILITTRAFAYVAEHNYNIVPIINKIKHNNVIDLVIAPLVKNASQVLLRAQRKLLFPESPDTNDFSGGAVSILCWVQPTTQPKTQYPHVVRKGEREFRGARDKLHSFVAANKPQVTAKGRRVPGTIHNQLGQLTKLKAAVDSAANIQVERYGSVVSERVYNNNPLHANPGYKPHHDRDRDDYDDRDYDAEYDDLEERLQAEAEQDVDDERLMDDEFNSDIESDVDYSDAESEGSIDPSEFVHRSGGYGGIFDAMHTELIEKSSGIPVSGIFDATRQNHLETQRALRAAANPKTKSRKSSGKSRRNKRRVKAGSNMSFVNATIQSVLMHAPVFEKGVHMPLEPVAGLFAQWYIWAVLLFAAWLETFIFRLIMLGFFALFYSVTALIIYNILDVFLFGRRNWRGEMWENPLHPRFILNRRLRGGSNANVVLPISVAVLILAVLVHIPSGFSAKIYQTFLAIVLGFVVAFQRHVARLEALRTSEAAEVMDVANAAPSGDEETHDEPVNPVPVDVLVHDPEAPELFLPGPHFMDLVVLELNARMNEDAIWDSHFVEGSFTADEHLSFVGAEREVRPCRSINRIYGGAGNQGAFIKTKNKGTGGKSKVKRDALPPLNHPPPPPEEGPPDPGVDQADEPAPEPVDPVVPVVIDWERIKTTYIHSDFPRLRSVHKFLEDVAVVDVECYGSPFCGVTCVDLALGKVPNVERYIEMCAGGNPIDVVGDSDYLGAYAAFRGVNLRIVQRIAGGANLGRYIELVHKMNNIDYDWITLIFHENPLGGVNHYTLACSLQASHHNFTFPRFNGTLLLEVDYLGVYSSPNDRDVRNVADRREVLKYQDSYVHVRLVRLTYLYIGLRFLFDLIDGILDVLAMLLFYMGELAFGLQIAIPLWRVPGWLRATTRHWLTKGLNLTVSCIRASSVYAEMQVSRALGFDATKALSLITRMRDVNTDVNLGTVIDDTCRYMTLLIDNFEPCDKTPVELGLVAYDVPGRNAAINNIGAIANAHVDDPDNQLNGGDIPLQTNKVLKYRLGTGKTRKPVMVAPIGPVYTSEGAAMGGLYPDTSSESLLAAFTSRNIKDPRDAIPVDFIDFSRAFVEAIVAATDFSGMDEPDIPTAFADIYSKSKGRKYVETMLAAYDLFRRGLAERKYFEHKCFVKFEDSAKIDESGELRVKPRLICVMSNAMLLDCCPVVKLLDRFNCGPFQKFQVKHITPEEMAAKISLASDREHIVTDYSSFESSIDEHIREIELHGLDLMCVSAGFTRTKASIARHAHGVRYLRPKFGKLSIGTRCSGDFWTSYGNGLLNVSINLYAFANKQIASGLTDMPTIKSDIMKFISDNEFQMLAEGDDGLIDKKFVNVPVVNSLGFKFSSSVSGSRDGDTDFLGSRWIAGKRYLNIGKVLIKMVWVKNACQLRRNKQLYLLRCMAASIHSLSPGHPVLTAMVERVGQLTAGKCKFKNAHRYLDRWKFPIISSSFPRELAVDESMRPAIAEGAIGFPPISVIDQLELERNIRDDMSVYVGSVLSEYDVVRQSCSILSCTDEHVPSSPDFIKMVDTLPHITLDGYHQVAQVSESPLEKGAGQR